MSLKIDKANLYCHFDHIKQLPIMVFRGSLTEELIAEAHQWLSVIIKQLAANHPIQGLIYDLQEVKRFSNAVIEFDHAATNILPIALIVSNIYQESQLRDVSPEEERKWLVNSYPEAFDFIQSYNAAARSIEHLGLEEHSTILNTESASVYYDVDKHHLFVTYYGAVTPVVTADVYATIAAVMEQYIESVRAGIFDFRHVSGFENANLTTVRRTSSNLNANYDMNHIAVPLIVGTAIQERMVMVSMKITPQEERKKIVHSDAEALKFIEAFHAKRLSKTK